MNWLAKEKTEAGSVLSLVDILKSYSNRADLLDDLVRVAAQVGKKTRPSPELLPTRSSSRDRLLVNRLTDDDVAAIIKTYQAGATAKEVAARYGIGTTTLKRLLRKHNIRKRGKYNIKQR